MTQTVTIDGTPHTFPDEATPEMIAKALNVSYEKPPEGAAETAKHWAGLTYRNAVEGAAGLPEMIGNIPAATANAARWAGDKALGIPASSSALPYAHPFTEGLDALDVTKPQNSKERLYGDVTKPLFAVATGGMGAKDLAKNGGWLENLLSKNLPLQYQAGVGGGAAGGIARENDLGPGAELMASLAGSFAAPGAWNVGKGVFGALAPFSEGGRDKIVSNVLATYADNPTKASANLKAAPQYVAGSPQTAGTSSGDYGLIKLEKGLNRADPFTDTIVAQNKARNDLLQKAAGTEKDVASAMAARKAATEPLYQLAATQPLNPDAISPILSKIDEKIELVGAKSDAGKTLLDLKNKIKGSLPSMEAQNTGLLDSTGTPITKPAFSNVTQSPLVQIFKETRDNLIKKGDQPGAYGATVRGVIQPVNQMLGEALESQSPVLRQANQKFRDLSMPINQMENMQGIYKHLQIGTPDAGGYFTLSPTKAANLFKEGQWNTDYNGWQPLEKALSPEQYQALHSVNQDLTRANLVNNPAVKAVGSETFANLASANALNKATGGTVNIGIPGSKWLYDKANPMVQQNLIDTLQDPAKAAKLLMTGTPNNTGPIVPTLFGNLARAAYAGQTY